MLVSLNELRQDLANARVHDPHDHEMLTQLLGEEIEYRERRILFFRAMRHPEMRLLYKALWHLKWDKGVDISSIQSLDMERYGSCNDCWLLLTDKWLVTTLQANNPDLDVDDFLSFRLHDDTDPFCGCSDCRDALMCHLSCKAYYVALMEREQAEVDCE